MGGSGGGERAAGQTERKEEIRGKSAGETLNSASNGFYGRTFLPSPPSPLAPRDETAARCPPVSLRYVAFANFNEPEWLAAADSTFLQPPHRDAARSASRACRISCDRDSLRSYGLPECPNRADVRRRISRRILDQRASSLPL